MRPVELAESALLGVLLLDPSRVAEVPWLGPDDFVEAGRGAIFDEVRRQVAAGGNVDAPSIAHALRGGRQQGRLDDVHRDLVSANRLHSLVAMTPRSAPDDVKLYGRMVLEASLRRQVRGGLGIQISAAPLGEPVLAPARVIEAASRVLTSVEWLGGRWNISTSEPAAKDPPSIETPVDTYRHQLAGARQVGQLEPPQQDVVAAAERHLIAAAITGLPINSLVERFGPDDFANPATAATWQAVATLHDGGRPVNVVTVAWEQQRSAASNGSGLPIDELQELASVPPVGVEADADLVAASLLNRLAETASSNLTAAADHAGLEPLDVMATAQLTVDAVRHVAERVSRKAANPSAAAVLAEQANRAGAPTEPATLSTDFTRHPGVIHRPVGDRTYRRTGPRL